MKTIEQLSIEEKIRLLTGRGMWHTFGCDGTFPELHLSDGPHGLRKQNDEATTNNDAYESTCYPTACASACSWDTEGIYEVGKALGKEAKRAEVSVVLGPGVNIKRSPLCGRNFEYFSEDPYLAGKMGASFIKGVEEQGIGTSLKHFAGNSQETHRMTANSQIDERALREIYLSAFEIAVKESKPATVMASYNRLNGEKVTESKYLMTDILRGEWGYEGAVVSDWGACCDLVSAVKAGLDLEMPDSLGFHSQKMMKAYENGEISEQEIDVAVQRILHLIEKYQIVHSEKVEDNQRDRTHQLALEFALKCAILLKNDGVLPIMNKESNIAIIGGLAENLRFQGGGSSHINTKRVTSPIEAMKRAGLTYEYAKGYESDSVVIRENLEEEAVNLAANTEMVLFFAGLTDVTEGEGYDRTTLELPSNQIHLYNKIKEKNSNIVVVSFGGAPFDFSFAGNAGAILHMYLAGEASGEALVKLLLGEVSPSGKLAESWPVSIEDTPCYGQFATGSDDIEYRESIYVGYRYYDTFEIPVQFPFGYGLSYTEFEYSNLNISTQAYKGGTLFGSVVVKNIGAVPGAEIVQIYVKNPKGNGIRAKKELRYFMRTRVLQPGEEQKLTFELEERSFAAYNVEKKEFSVISGEYEILAAASLTDIRLAEKITVTGEDNFLEKAIYEDYCPEHKNSLFLKESFRAIYGKPFSHFDELKKGDFTVVNSIDQLAEKSVLAKVFKLVIKPVIYSMYKGIDHRDPEVQMALCGALEGSIDAVICHADGAIPYKVIEAMVLEANGKKIQAIKKLFEKRGSKW